MERTNNKPQQDRQSTENTRPAKNGKDCKENRNEKDCRR